MVDRTFKLQLLDQMIDHTFSTPTGSGAAQVALAVAIGVEQPGDIGIAELFQVRDAIGFSGFPADQDALRRAANSRAQQNGPVLDGFEVGCMQLIPVVERITAIAGRYRLMVSGYRKGGGQRNLKAHGLQTTLYDDFAEPAFKRR